MGIDLGAGAKALAFKLPRDGGGSVALKDFKGRGLVLYFYPKADTPAARAKLLMLRSFVANSRRPERMFWGVSADPAAARDKFKHDLTVALGSDETHEMLEAYGGLGGKPSAFAAVHRKFPEN